MKRLELLVGGPFDKQEVDPDTFATFGYPTKWIMPLKGGESAIYARISPGSLGYCYTRSDE